MIHECKNGVILSVKGSTVRYRRDDGQEFDFNTFFDMKGREDELVGQFLQVRINTTPGNYTFQQAITLEAV